MSLLRLSRAFTAAARPLVQASIFRPATFAVPRRHIGTPAPSEPIKTVDGVPQVPEDKASWMVGRQLEELELELEGVGGFNDSPAEGPFGTIAKPVKIYSAFHSRIVGCKGGDHNQHRMFWFELKEGPKHVCTQCGQVFQLVTPNNIAAIEGIKQ